MVTDEYFFGKTSYQKKNILIHHDSLLKKKRMPAKVQRDRNITV